METFRLTLYGLLFEQVTATTFHYALNSSPLGNRLEAVINAFNTYQLGGAGGSLFGRIVAATTTDWSATSIRAVRVAEALTSRFFREEIYVADNVGLQVAPTLPPQDCAVISRRGLVAIRANYGRIFVPAVPQAMVTDGRIDVPSAYATALGSLRNALVAPITGSDSGAQAHTFKPVLLRRVKDPITGSYKIAWDVDGNPLISDVSSGLVDTIVRTQRRRQLHRGI